MRVSILEAFGIFLRRLFSSWGEMGRQRRVCVIGKCVRKGMFSVNNSLSCTIEASPVSIISVPLFHLSPSLLLLPHLSSIQASSAMLFLFLHFMSCLSLKLCICPLDSFGCPYFLWGAFPWFLQLEFPLCLFEYSP